MKILQCQNPDCEAHNNPTPDDRFISFDVLQFSVDPSKKFIQIDASKKLAQYGFYCAKCEIEAVEVEIDDEGSKRIREDCEQSQLDLSFAEEGINNESSSTDQRDGEGPNSTVFNS